MFTDLNANVISLACIKVQLKEDERIEEEICREK